MLPLNVTWFCLTDSQMTILGIGTAVTKSVASCACFQDVGFLDFRYYIKKYVTLYAFLIGITLCKIDWPL